MLKDLEEGMNKALVNAPTYREKKLIYQVCELYTPDNVSLSPFKKFELFKKFSLAYEKLKEKPEV